MARVAEQGQFMVGRPDGFEKGLTRGASMNSIGLRAGPDDFDLLVKSKHFRLASDRDVVTRLYRRLSYKNLGSVTRLSFEGMQAPTDADARSLAGCLNHCDALVRLDLQGVGMTDSALQALLLRLERGSLPNLRVLRVDNISEVGLLALAEALQFRHTALKLDELHLSRNDAGDEVKRRLRGVRAGLTVIQA
jgi:ABC-type transporter Mla MlaB component